MSAFVRPAHTAAVRWVLALVLVASIVVLVVTQGPERRWMEGTTHDGWTTVFDGYGTVSAEHGRITLDPRATSGPTATHGALVVSTDRFGDLRTQATITTLAQHRAGAPNPWEVGWFVWHYTNRSAFYAVVLKPTGWEISKQDPAYPGAQRFLASGTSPTFAVGGAHSVVVTQRGATFTVSAGGRTLATVTDTERPYLRGAVGLYTEDAKVMFTNLTTTGEPI
ncbi:MAG TPA: hypothetical protein PLV41_07875 [Miltoncostaeales bacterium]|jgi:hypothetical protein|nr:hypothetical protein [Miltoncostaeales bacterium]